MEYKERIKSATKTLQHLEEVLNENKPFRKTKPLMADLLFLVNTYAIYNNLYGISLSDLNIKEETQLEKNEDDFIFSSPPFLKIKEKQFCYSTSYHKNYTTKTKTLLNLFLNEKTFNTLTLLFEKKLGEAPSIVEKFSNVSYSFMKEDFLRYKDSCEIFLNQLKLGKVQLNQNTMYALLTLSKIAFVENEVIFESQSTETDIEILHDCKIKALKKSGLLEERKTTSLLYFVDLKEEKSKQFLNESFIHLKNLYKE